MTVKFKIGKSSKEDYKKFLKKADEFYEMRLISDKNLVEYDGRLLSRREAELLAKHAERFLVWVRTLLP